jgi:hypothetical protein
MSQISLGKSVIRMILQIKEQMKTQHQKTDITHGTHPGIGFKILLKASNKLTHNFS